MPVLRYRDTASALVPIFLSLALLACAKPQYVTPGSLGAPTEGKTDEGCSARFKASNACVTILWQKVPNETEYGSFIFTVKDGTSNLVTDLEQAGAPLKVVLVMPGMSHPNPPVVLKKLAPGVYQASEVFFLMSGPWEIHFLVGSDQAIHALVH